MWEYVVRFLLRNRVAVLIFIFIITCFMGYKATKVQLSYEMARMLPVSDINNVNYEEFKKIFGEDGSVFFIGIKDPNIFQLDKFNSLYDLTNKIRNLDGIEQVLCINNVYTITKNDSTKKFDFIPVINQQPKNQAELDSLKEIIHSLKFYKGLLYNSETNTYLMGVTISKYKLNDASRFELVAKVRDIVEEYRTKNNIEVHYSGLPYIRTVITQMIEKELKLFIAISLLIAFVIVFLFFRSFHVVFTSLLIVIVSIIWALGSIVLFKYKITILIGVIPSLLIIIAIENCIYLVNKYHWEYKSHGNKILSISRVVTRIGFATFITNVTTATGFAAFIFTSNAMLKEFGIISSINVMIEYALSLILTTIIFSYLPSPKPKQLKHLENKSMTLIIDKIKYVISIHRKYIYAISIAIILVCIYGTTKMEISGKLVDDIPKENPLYIDMKFFESNFGGVMPFEILIDTKKENGILADNAKTLYKIKKLQNFIKNDSAYSKYFSRPVSIVEAMSFAYQAYKGGDPKYYILPPITELAKMKEFLGDSINSRKNAFHSFIDDKMQRTRVSIQMADVGTKEMNNILSTLRPKVDSIFNDSILVNSTKVKEYKKVYNVTITGNSIVFTKGTEYLIKNLWESIIIGIFIISLLMAIIFSSLRMILIAMIVNIIPLLITAAIMGYFSIPIKPSTIIVFSIALGISVDNAILFLSWYRHEIKVKKHNYTDSVMIAMNEAGISMIYTSVVLVVGFSIFMLSGFGGTKALGMLISITLFMALFFNIIVLPALILSFEKLVTTKAFKEPIIEVFDNDDELENEIDIKNNI